ncbi:MAG: SCO family protein [Myxococcota bacterium]|jgi:protein SCO1/2|nr:SCO family protein [Myxococcota bacterium]
MDNTSHQWGLRVDRFMKRWVGHPGFWLLWVALIFSWPITRAVRANLPDALPQLGQVAHFSLTNQYGANFNSEEQLAGKIWVANFIFTRCPTVCPAFTKKMFEVQHRVRHLHQAVQLVSFSVDPDYDTPERLLEYAQEHRASPFMWSFLTGPLEAVKSTVSESLKNSMGGQRPDGNFEGIFHGSHFVLIDGAMQIRGFYNAEDEGSMDELLSDMSWVVNRGG